jgi:hypothetical protein
MHCSLHHRYKFSASRCCKLHVEKTWIWKFSCHIKIYRLYVTINKQFYCVNNLHFTLKQLCFLGQYSVWLQTGRPGFDPRQRQRIFFCSLCVQTSSESHPVSYPVGTGSPFPEGKAQPGSDPDHSPPSSAEVKNVQELYSSSPWRLHGDSGTPLLFYFTVYLNKISGYELKNSVALHLTCIFSNSSYVWNPLTLPLWYMVLKLGSLILCDEHRLAVFDNRVFAIMVGPKRDEVTWKWRKVHNEELHYFYSSQNFILMITGSVRCSGHVLRMGRWVVRRMFRLESLRVRLLGRPRRRWKGTIKIDLRETRMEGVVWIHMAEDRFQLRTAVNVVVNLWAL